MSQVEHFPRVLIVGVAPFGLPTGAGITLSNLFHGWPDERLAQIFTMAVGPSMTAGPQHFHLHPRHAPADYYARRLLTRGGRPLVSGAPDIAAVGSARARHSLMAMLHTQLRAVADLSPLHVPKRLSDWVRDYRPDVVYSLLGNVRMMRLAYRVAHECQRPLIPHFMDDWVTTLYTNGELLGRARAATQASLRHVIRLADRGICISQPMATEYERRYGIPFTAFVNCVDESAFAEPGVPTPANTVNLVYVGGLHLDRWKSLQQIGAVLTSINTGEVKAQLTIHAPATDIARHADAFVAQPAVRLAQPLRGPDVPDVLKRADVLIHVESFAEDVRRYTRLSLSTKVPQYLAAGRPIFGYGPADLASMLHIRSARAGLVVGVEDPVALAEQLRRLRSDATLRARLAHNGYVYARKYHRRDIVAAQFAAFLRSASNAQLRRPKGLVAT